MFILTKLNDQFTKIERQKLKNKIYDQNRLQNLSERPSKMTFF